jgi:sulfhydrogenase subunit beta (sulfur reductase)
MAELPIDVGSVVALAKPGLEDLLSRLREKGYQTVGPRVSDGTVKYQPISGTSDMPQGYASEIEAGKYRLVSSGNSHFFDYIPGAQSWKQIFFPPRSSLLSLRKNGGWKSAGAAEPSPRYALIGVRPCEIAAIKIQDLAFLRNDFTDPIYQERRKNAFLLAVNCVRPGGTCFCASMGTGPQLSGGFDLGLTELDDLFLVEIGTPAGKEAMTGLSIRKPDASAIAKGKQAVDAAKTKMGRQLDTRDLPDLLLKNLNHPEWDAVAKRCLSCASCTLACPTCFCWDTQDHTSLNGAETERERVWDSCFNPGYSYQAGGNTRPNTRSRYRQWLTHKLGTWKQQYDVLGCVGCGRCITWCPVGIDITEEVRAIRESEQH